MLMRMRPVLVIVMGMIRILARIAVHMTCRTVVPLGMLVFMPMGMCMGLTAVAVLMLMLMLMPLERKGKFQVIPFQERLIRKDLCSGAVRGNDAFMNDYATAADVEDEVQIMRGHDLRMGKRLKQLDQPPPRLGIKVCRRFVHDQDVRFHGKDRSDRHRALLPSGKMMRRFVAQLQRANGPERILDPFADTLFIQTQVERAEGHVIEDRGHEELVVGVLKDHPHPLANFLRRPLLEQHVADGHRARRGHEKTVHMQKKGRLARAVGAHDPH